MFQSLSCRKGFTLIELLVVIVILFILVSVALGGGCYSLVSSKTIEGTVDTIQNITPQMVAGDQGVAYSFAVSITCGDEDFTFSAEDRQWATIKTGDHVKAKIFPYAPWDFARSGTFHGGRLLKKFKK
jgi:prepilin-type N-terminal cleavage/methylation domain-containing protein